MGMSASQARLLTLTSRMSDVEFSSQQMSNSKTRLADQSEQVTQAYSDALDKKKLIFQTDMVGGVAQYIDVTANVLTRYSTDQTQRILTNGNGQVMVASDMKSNYDKSVAANGGGFEKFLANYGLAKDATSATTSLTYDKDKVAYYQNIYDAAQAGGGMVQPPNDQLLNDESWMKDQFDNGKLYLDKWDKDKIDTNGKGGFDSISYQSGDAQIQEVTDDHGIDLIKAKYDSDMASINNKDKKFDLSQKSLDTEHSALQTEYDSVKKVIDKNIERSYKTFSG